MAERKTTSKSEWARSNDSGPHVATLPTGAVVKFRIPDTAALARNGNLPEDLRETAMLVAAHPDGPEGYFGDLVSTAVIRGENSKETITKLIDEGMSLMHHLVAHMLIEPKVNADDVKKGMFHELDIRMLGEFAERRRNVDAAGVKLPIITLDEWATFRAVDKGAPAPAPGGGNGAAADGTAEDPGDSV